MIQNISFPTELKPFFELYSKDMDLSKEEFDETLRRSVIGNDHVFIADKNGSRIYGFVIAKTSSIRERRCIEVLLAWTRDNNRSTWGALVKSLLKWADERGINDVYVLRNLRARR